MRHLHLKLLTREAWLALAIEPEAALHIIEIGYIADPTDAIGEDGAPVMRIKRGWHIDLICEDERDLSWLDPYVVGPVTPRHVLA